MMYNTIKKGVYSREQTHICHAEELMSCMAWELKKGSYCGRSMWNSSHLHPMRTHSDVENSDLFYWFCNIDSHGDNESNRSDPVIEAIRS